MLDTLIVTNDKYEVVRYLNEVLQNHPQYESWMKFDDFEVKGQYKVPRYKSPADGETQLSKQEYVNVYTAVAKQVLGS